MTQFYIKNKQQKYVPVEITNVLGKELDEHLVVVRVGNDECTASSTDLDETTESFCQAEVLKQMKNLSIIVTPYQIDVDIFAKEDLEDKCIFLQITSGHDVVMLEDQIRKMYNKIKKKHETVVVPTPLKVKDYRQVQEVLKRSQLRKDRRGNKSK